MLPVPQKVHNGAEKGGEAYKVKLTAGLQVPGGVQVLPAPFLYIILFATGLPITAIMVPVYGVFVQLSLLDSVTATALFLADATKG
jgi:hypothetical protein